jgi:two-component system KDP operon response regulator KdpE
MEVCRQWGTFDDGTLHVDFGQREVTVEGQPVHLSPKQYLLLVTLVRRQGHRSQSQN